MINPEQAFEKGDYLVVTDDDDMHPAGLLINCALNIFGSDLRVRVVKDRRTLEVKKRFVSTAEKSKSLLESFCGTKT